MADGGGIATRENSGHPLALPGQLRSPDRVNPAVDRMKSPRRHPVPDRLVSVVETKQLGATHHTVLPASKRPKPSPSLFT